MSEPPHCLASARAADPVTSAKMTAVLGPCALVRFAPGRSLRGKGVWGPGAVSCDVAPRKAGPLLVAMETLTCPGR